MTHFNLLTLFVIICSLNQAAGEVYYITTNSTDLCTAQPCLTLSQFAANSSHYLHSNTTLVFVPGMHYLSEINLTLSNVDNIVLMSENSTAQIECGSDSHIHFNQSQNVHITNLWFIACGGNQVSHVEEFLVKGTMFEGQDNSETALELIETIAQIVNCTFISNRRGSYRLCLWYVPVYRDTSDHRFLIGGAIIATNSSISISQSNFEGNRADVGGAIFAESSIININGSAFLHAESIIDDGVTVLLFNYSNNGANKVLNFKNNTAKLAGGVVSCFNSTITIEETEFHSNHAAYDGGVLYSVNSTITIKKSKFGSNNTTVLFGGVLSVLSSSTITIEASEFDSNSAKLSGGALYSAWSTITINTSRFHGNTDVFNGAVVYVTECSVTIEASKFRNNSAEVSGVLYSENSDVTIVKSEFTSNSASNEGGVMDSYNSTITISESIFSENISPNGAVIYATYGSKIQYHNCLVIDNNSAVSHAVIYLFDSEFRGFNSGNITFSNNIGSLMALNSSITFSGYAMFMNNKPQNDQGIFQEGGSVTVFQSSVSFDGECNLEYNHAENGGAIHATESKLFVNGNVTIAYNTATGNGGGVYLSTSELNCQRNSSLVLNDNRAMNKGGGLHAISSSIKGISSVFNQRSYDGIYTGTNIAFTKNAAKFGGGLSLEANAKFYILRNDWIAFHDYLINGINANTAIFIANSADYGGAMYVDDDTNSGTCASVPKTECFFQVLAVYRLQGLNPGGRSTQCIYFSQNSAYVSGSTLYGGLLDRCAVNPFAEVYKIYALNDNTEEGGGIAYFKNVSNTTNISMSSGPVQICLCTSNLPSDCTHKNQVKVKKGEAFPVSLMAVDQVGQPVSATIQASLYFVESGLAEGQLAKNILAKCTTLTFNLVSPHMSETLALYASNGPCRNVELSRATIGVHFLPCSCPIGLQISGINNSNCTCECHSKIAEYVEHCDSHNGLLVKKPQAQAWIYYISVNNLSGYLIYPNCPFDYCLSLSPPIYLNKRNGADAQCAFNRSSLLCGSCQPGLSLSLGSSHCLPCPSYWPALLVAITIAAILAGIALVALLLVLNMTVAIGTLNGLIFYANVVHANKSILLPFQRTNIITVFISWLNLDLGIDMCYFPGMDTYIKTWLKLSFPAYIIFLVVLVIIISSYSTKFSNLIGKKNPVATLATLILLSYAKLIEVCFISLSVGVVQYPDGSSKILWLPDASVKYLSAKHITLLIATVLILVVGLIYTAILFLWQCLLRLPKWRVFKWSRNPKIQTFIETYHTPYTPKHRYWTGMLLIVRVVLYLVAAANVSNDPNIALTAITCTVGCIIFLKGFIGSRLYKNWLIDVLETYFHLNIFLLTIFTWYYFSKQSVDQAIAYTSVTITITVLLLIILYHLYTYTSLFSKVKKTKLGKNMDRYFTDTDSEPQQCYNAPPDDEDYMHRCDDRQLLDELDCPVYTGDYDTTPLLRPPTVEPTFSVVELHHPCLPPPDHKGASYAQNNPPKSTG